MNIHTLTLTPNQSADEWEALYLLALSHLNFEHHLRLLLLPNTMDTCTWDKKQWQALTLFGLDSCHHIKGPPPIESKQVNWASARKLIIGKQTDLVHICHWQNPSHFQTWLPMASVHDTLILFGKISQANLLQVAKHWPNNNTYVVKTESQPHINQGIEARYVIDYPSLANLLQQNLINLAWK